MRSLVSIAPEPTRGERRGLSVERLLARASTYRTGTGRDVVSLTKLTLRALARRSIELEEEIKGYDPLLEPLVTQIGPEFVAPPRRGARRSGRALGCRGRQS
jgi:hypothetical protein